MIPPQPTSYNAQSVIARLRPRSVGEILDQAFRLYRRHFLTFLAITAVVFVPVNLAVQTASVSLQGSTRDLSYGTGYSNYATRNEEVIGLFLQVGLLLLLAVADAQIGLADPRPTGPRGDGGDREWLSALVGHPGQEVPLAA